VWRDQNAFSQSQIMAGRQRRGSFADLPFGSRARRVCSSAEHFALVKENPGPRAKLIGAFAIVECSTRKTIMPVGVGFFLGLNDAARSLANVPYRSAEQKTVIWTRVVIC